MPEFDIHDRNGLVHYDVEDSAGVRWEYRMVSSRLERRRCSQKEWWPVRDGEWASMTPDELELIAHLIRKAMGGAHVTTSRGVEAGR